MHTTSETTIQRIRKTIKWTPTDCPSCGGIGLHPNPDQEEAARITHAECYGCGGDGFVNMPGSEVKMVWEDFDALCAEMSHIKSDLEFSEDKVRRLESRLNRDRLVNPQR